LTICSAASSLPRLPSLTEQFRPAVPFALPYLSPCRTSRHVRELFAETDRIRLLIIQGHFQEPAPNNFEMTLHDTAYGAYPTGPILYLFYGCK
jgi:hypothetical protein